MAVARTDPRNHPFRNFKYTKEKKGSGLRIFDTQYASRTPFPFANTEINEKNNHV